MRRMRTLACLIVLFSSALCIRAAGQDASSPPARPNGVPSADVVYRGEVLFTLVGNLGAITPAQRAEAITQRIEAAASNRLFEPAAIKVVEEDIGSAVTTEDSVFMLVLDADARHSGMSRQALANAHAEKIRAAIEKRRDEYRARSVAVSIAEALAATIVLAVFFVLLRRFGPLLSGRFEKRERRIVEAQKLGSHQLYCFVRRTLLGDFASPAGWLCW